MAVDPGSSFVGVAMFDMCDNDIVKIHTWTIRGSNVTRSLYGNVKTSNLQYSDKIEYICSQIESMVEDYEPSAVGVETPFYGLSAQTFASLTNTYTSICSTIGKTIHDLPVYGVTPSSGKSSVGALHKKFTKLPNKEKVKAAISELPEITDVMDQPLDSLSEHAIDAIAVCYAMLERDFRWKK